MKFFLDAIVLLAYFGVIVGIGLSQRKKNDSVEGYTLGDRQIAWWAVLASILAAEISAATFLGAPESGYTDRNWAYAQFAIGTILARIIVSFLFIPLFYRHGVISLYEYLETRFGGVTRRFASATSAGVRTAVSFITSSSSSSTSSRLRLLVEFPKSASPDASTASSSSLSYS
jgi:Na+/proline symporter